MEVVKFIFLILLTQSAFLNAMDEEGFVVIEDCKDKDAVTIPQRKIRDLEGKNEFADFEIITLKPEAGIIFNEKTADESLSLELKPFHEVTGIANSSIACAKPLVSLEELTKQEFIKKDAIVFSIKTLIEKEKLLLLDCYDNETECLNLSHKGLESLSGLKKLLSFYLKGKKITSLDVSNNKLPKLNYYKMDKFGIKNVDAENNLTRIR